MSRHYILAAALLLCLPFSSRGQTAKPKTVQPSTRDDRPTAQTPWPGPNKEQDGPALPDEMRTRLAIERAEIEHRKILDSATQVGDLAADVQKHYRERGKLSSEDLKKVGTIEKLAKRILSNAGGEEVETKNKGTEQMSLATAIDQLNVAGAKVKRNVTVETRFVVSMAVISDSNEIIRLAQFIRRAQK